MRKIVLVLLFVAAAAAASNPLREALRGRKGHPLLESLIAGHREPLQPQRKSSRLVQEGSIEQRLDHFDADNIDIFRQRFLSNYEFFDVDVGGPLFIMVGGEWPVTDMWLVGGHMYDLAEEHGGAMFYLEHRFYGMSFPTNRSADLETLQFLTAEQALYDLAYFTEQIRFILPHFENSDIILVGTSLGGSLVTWYQKTYFDLVDGAWASSAPVNAVADFTEAKEVSGAALRRMGGDMCHNRVRNAFAALEDLFEQNNYNQIRNVFNICPDTRIETDRGMWTLFEVFSTEFSILAALSSPMLYDMVCQAVLAAPSDLEGLAAIQEIVFEDECIDFDYEYAIEALQEDEWEDEWNLEFRLVLWQFCSEFGWFPSSSSPNQPFGSSFPMELFTSLCNDVYEIDADELEENVAATNERFLGLNPTVQNIITTQGRNDPFRPAGLQEDTSETSTTIIIEGTGHGGDLWSYDAGEDSMPVRDAKRRIAEAVRRWLN